MPAELPTLSLEELSNREKSMVSGLTVMNTTVENNGSNLFTKPLEKAHLLEGTAKTTAVMDVGLYREMVCDVYTAVRIPEVELRLEATRELIQNKAKDRAETLQQLLENGYINLTDYSTALAPLRQYLPEGFNMMRLPFTSNMGDEAAFIREAIMERIAGLKLKGSRKTLVDELLNALTPQTEYPNRALQLAVYPQPGSDGTRPKLASIINSARPVLRSVGVDIITRKAAADSAYRLGLYESENNEIIGPPSNQPGLMGVTGELSEDMIGISRKDTEARISAKIVSAGLAKKQMVIVQGLVGSYSPDSARMREEWAAKSYPDVAQEKADNRLSAFLPYIRKRLETVGVYIHFHRSGFSTSYYLSENPEPEPKQNVVKQGEVRRVGRHARMTEANEPVSANEISRREIEERVRNVTIGTVQRSLVEDDE